MIIIYQFNANELESLATDVINQDKGDIQHLINQRAAEALIVFSQTLAKKDQA